MSRCTTRSSFFLYVDAQIKKMVGRQVKTMAVVFLLFKKDITKHNRQLSMLNSRASVRSAGSQLREKKLSLVRRNKL